MKRLRERLSNRLASRWAQRVRRAERGMTLLEIMIVLAILALVMGLVVGPKVMRLFGKSKVQIAKIAADKLANESYVEWGQSHTGKQCPDKIDELTALQNADDANDPWGRPYKMFCGSNLPAGVKGGIGIASDGADGKEGTPDDIKSWEKAPEE
jgi:general secretion pathway protein G